MTKQRNDEHGTEFGEWLRNQPEIDSGLGYVTTNIDYLWRCYKTNLWMFIEEKRYMSKVERWQRECFCVAHKAVKGLNYRGFHLIQFEKTSPDDGKIYLDCKEISKKQLIEFLQFKPSV